MNRAVLRTFGCETEKEFRELTGGTFQGLVHPEDREAVEASIREQISPFLVWDCFVFRVGLGGRLCVGQGGNIEVCVDVFNRVL